MLKNVNIRRRGIRLAASGLTSEAAIVTEPDAHVQVGNTHNVEPAEISLELEYNKEGNGQFELAIRESTGDEYIRTGDTLRFALPARLLWPEISPTSAQPSDPAEMQQLKPKLRVIFLSDCEKVDEAAAETTRWTGTNAVDMIAHTNTLTIPDKVDAVQIEIEFFGEHGSATVGSDRIRALSVFGGEDVKHLLFDNFGNELRERVVEGGNPLIGHEVVVAYTDWRANTLADTYKIDTQIGVVGEYAGRVFGYSGPIYGRLVHEVDGGVCFGDGHEWQHGQPLLANSTSRLLPKHRTSYEATLKVPGNVTGMAIYFHVRTFLRADYGRYYGRNITWWYQDGEKVLKSEKWDNPNGPYTNYEYDLDQAGGTP